MFVGYYLPSKNDIYLILVIPFLYYILNCAFTYFRSLLWEASMTVYVAGIEMDAQIYPALSFADLSAALAEVKAPVILFRIL